MRAFGRFLGEGRGADPPERLGPSASHESNTPHSVHKSPPQLCANSTTPTFVRIGKDGLLTCAFIEQNTKWVGYYLHKVPSWVCAVR